VTELPTENGQTLTLTIIKLHKHRRGSCMNKQLAGRGNTDEMNNAISLLLTMKARGASTPAR